MALSFGYGRMPRKKTYPFKLPALSPLEKGGEGRGEGGFSTRQTQAGILISMTDLRTLSETIQEARRRLKAIGEHL